MNLEELFSTKERISILREIVYSDRHVNAASIVNRLGLSKGLISKYLNLLKANKMVVKKKDGVFVENNVYTRAIKIILILNSFNLSLFRKYKFVWGVGLYGSCAKGENVSGSDIDIWIRVGNATELELAKLAKELKKRHGEIKPIFLSDAKIAKLRKEDSVFLNSLILGSIRIYGEAIEL